MINMIIKRPMKIATQKTSLIIEEIIESCEGEETVTLDEFLNKMGDKALAIAILVFALLALIGGAIPGFSTITGVPILLIALQMMIGRRTIYLPKTIRNKAVSSRMVQGTLTKALPPLKALEKLLRPRILWLTSPLCEKLIALVMVVLAVILSLPIPGGNFLPSMGIAILALAILERDGLLVIAATVMIALTAGIMLKLIRKTVHYIGVMLGKVF